ncbi:hypothetical protein ACFQI7_27995 [Paenibacillus allorhizosphaerae]|uniref:Uncharacterized protein n=1 Tax=Paenibacillus allorhizosphaerae TaxID=2849866 RepID=A0ABM8VNQ7_9BACL|nr:hypothetical protein [Paenibacillus allorhizosphaerae]CAG7651628.1 hypothetical protein PAECIP111802_05012 [Paenibacillus allorhizosphaerae]
MSWDKEDLDKEKWQAAYNKLSKAIWIKFLKPSNKYRKLSTKELEYMYEAINQGKSLQESYEYALRVYKALGGD